MLVLCKVRLCLPKVGLNVTGGGGTRAGQRVKVDFKKKKKKSCHTEVTGVLQLCCDRQLTLYSSVHHMQPEVTDGPKVVSVRGIFLQDRTRLTSASVLNASLWACCTICKAAELSVR